MRRNLCMAVGLALLCLAAAVPAGAQGGGGDKAAIEAVYQRFDAAFNKKDVDGIMAEYAPDVFVFDVIPPRQYVGWDAYKKDWVDLFAANPGPVVNHVTHLSITVVGPVAYTHYMTEGSLTDKDGKASQMAVRATDVLRKVKGKWLIVQEHNSVPVDMTTGQGDMLSKE
ncbi:MAG TPA: SgcJ/EcaC family oxidoreductase [Acidobacteriaceae bacterium]|nr:SgcJ/EcaC family oxidoreductase [Acidobacteriaceae bacterium]